MPSRDKKGVSGFFERLRFSLDARKRVEFHELRNGNDKPAASVYEMRSHTKNICTRGKNIAASSLTVNHSR